MEQAAHTPVAPKRVLPGEPVPRRHSNRPHSGDVRRAKLWLVLIFCALRGVDLAVYFTQVQGHRTPLVGALIVSSIWSTVLLGAIWLRHSWARYALIGVLILSSVVAMILIPALFRAVVVDRTAVALAVGAGVVNAALAWFLSASVDIRRLTDRHRREM